jgi:hypothetical protein
MLCHVMLCYVAIEVGEVDEALQDVVRDVQVEHGVEHVLELRAVDQPRVAAILGRWEVRGQRLASQCGHARRGRGAQARRRRETECENACGREERRAAAVIVCRPTASGRTFARVRRVRARACACVERRERACVRGRYVLGVDHAEAASHLRELILHQLLHGGEGGLDLRVRAPAPCEATPHSGSAVIRERRARMAWECVCTRCRTVRTVHWMAWRVRGLCEPWAAHRLARADGAASG